MPRYFFNTEDGVRATDSEGIECGSLEAVRVEASRQACEMLSDPEAFFRDAYWKLSVCDERGLMLFSLEVSATLAPVIRPAGRPS